MLVLALVGRLRVLRPGVVWGWQFLANVVSSTAARFVRVPHIVTAVENLNAWKTWPEYRQWWYRLADRLTARICDRVVANARALVADYAAWAKAVPERMRIVPNGFDVQGFLALPWRDLRPQLGITSDATVVLSLGRLAPEKNLSMLLRAWAALHPQDATRVLVIVGHGEQESALQELAQALGIAAHVVFAGRTTEPQSFYRAADVFVMTSRIEGMANVLMEAQLLGLPAVTTAAGGADEVVVDGETGFVVPIDDERAFVEALDTLLADPALRQRMGRLAAAHMQSHFSVQRSVDAIDAVIEELCRGEEPA
jgi:glycosyltransferase involved in cell wall biosynthesis